MIRAMASVRNTERVSSSSDSTANSAVKWVMWELVCENQVLM